MLEPLKISSVAKKYAEQNFKFRTFLKNRADPDELDARFLELHKELFADYDCCACSNCCKTYAIPFLPNEVTVISRFLGKEENDFIDEYLVESDEIDLDAGDHKQYKTKDMPCPFLRDDGKCRIQDCKPSNCKDFPFTDKPDRLESMYAVLDFAEICPVVFEILERLKKLYRFTHRR